MEITLKGIQVSISEQAIRQLVLEKLNGDERAATVKPGTLPRIGAEIIEMGGVFAGVARGVNGEPDYYLIAGPAASGSLPWQKATDWADGVEAHGFNDFALPTRKEQALLFANAPELFEKEWYWSSEQHAGISVYAWVQSFNGGNQGASVKDDNNRARAVRRVPIQGA